MAAEVTIYTLTYCPYCVSAKKLLEARGLAYKEIIVANDDFAKRDELKARSGMKTFPQIFFGEKLIGGYSELKQLDESVGLQAALKQD